MKKIYIESESLGNSFLVIVQDDVKEINESQSESISAIFRTISEKVSESIQTKTGLKYSECYVRWVDITDNKITVGFGGVYKGGKRTEGKMEFEDEQALIQDLRSIAY